MAKYIDDYYVGETASFTKTITDADILMFGAASGDMYPLHFNQALAEKTIFGGRVAHGALTSGLVSTVTGSPLQGQGTCDCCLRDMYSKYLAPVRSGDTIATVAVVSEVSLERKIVKMDVTCTNQHGVQVLTGYASIRVLIDRPAI
ncbi:MaoC family dehydratase [Clostridia bacterium OttesenSCG-928-F22]|nr:MaoC family dehydratase [Clostridia bacterium OttesenSCG-928-F22]